MRPLGLAWTAGGADGDQASRGGGGGGGIAGAGGGAGDGGERGGRSGGGGGAVARLLALAERMEVEARDVPKRTRPRVSLTPRVTLLSFEPADARVVLALDELRDAGRFERLFRAQAGRVPFGDEGLRTAWASCFSMVLHGKCKAVC